MNSRLLYLSLDFLSLLFPLLFSFYPRFGFYRKWKFLWPALLITSVIFIAWDIAFTRIGVWGFNPDYILGIYFINLPFEEVLFFVCVPYACVFTYEAVSSLRKGELIQRSGASLVSDLLVIGLIIAGIYFHSRWYTAVTFISTGAFILFLNRIARVSFLGRFYFAFLFILIPFFIINGILTGTGINSPVVWYNNSENMGIRMGTIPAEDTFYGMLLLLMNVFLFEAFQKKAPLRPV